MAININNIVTLYIKAEISTSCVWQKMNLAVIPIGTGLSVQKISITLTLQNTAIYRKKIQMLIMHRYYQN